VDDRYLALSGFFGGDQDVFGFSKEKKYLFSLGCLAFSSSGSCYPVYHFMAEWISLIL